jgi:kojibiose phosphorylase
MRSYEKRQWQVRQSPFKPLDLAHTETILTIGNGLVGVRGTFEEGYPGDAPATLIAGIFNHKPGTLVPELVSIPNWLALTITINGDAFRLDQGKILGYERVLDLRTATLTRGVLWLSPNQSILRLAFERFASQANPHVLALRVLIQPLSEGTHQLAVTSALDGSILNPGGVDHWAVLQGGTEDDMLHINGVTEQSSYCVALAARLLVEDVSPQWSDASVPRIPAHTASFRLAQNQKVVVTKLVSIHSTRDGQDPVTASRLTLADAIEQGYDALKAAHDAAWADYWDAVDIVIEGDEVAQRAVRFCTYHILIAMPPADERVSIAAKSLSGFGYKGHVFWDTELFIIPLLTLAHPESACRLLMYRYHNLAGARAKAREASYEGAMYPWESADTGEETTPRWTNPHPITGERIRIWTGDNEQHISTDIAYAILQYWRWTGDDAWFMDYGAEMVLDTARFWGSRAEYNMAQDRYELRMQIGPDEYHENIDNSVFTNRMVVWHLQQAQQVWDWLSVHHPQTADRLGSALDITPERLAHWGDIAAKMWINVNQGVFEQFQDFFERLQPFNLEDYTPRTVNMDRILGREKTQHARVIKQADVVMLMALLGDELGDRDFLRRNWDMYADVVDHGSSLSPSIHAWVASRLGLVEEAYDLFIYAATIDLEDNKGNVRDGIHAASCGGVWQALVFGFCGLQLTPDGPQVNPALPAHWREIRFKVRYKGQLMTFTIPQGSTT